MFIPIIYNGALLVLLVSVADVFSSEKIQQKRVRQVLHGLVLGLICIAVMLNPWKAAEGVVFDTRSILLSIAGLFFGFIPAFVAGCLTIAYRLFQGGAGTVMGVCVIAASVTTGILWRYRHKGRVGDIKLFELLVFGLAVHFLMFLCAFALPVEVRYQVMSTIGLPVFTVYPAITVLLGAMLSWSQKRNRLNQVLRENENKYRLLADNTIDSIWIMSTDGRFQFINPAGYDLLGYTSEEMSGRGLWEICDEKNYKIFRGEIDALISNPSRNNETLFECEILTKDKRKISVENTCRLVLDDQGRPASLQGVTRDITERKRIESETERLRLAVEQTAEAIMITDTEGIIVYVNPAFEKTSGYSRQEAIGHKVSLLESGKHSQAFFEQMWATLRSGRNWSGNFINRRKDGTVYTEEASISPVFDADGTIVYFIAAKRDITYENELEQQLRQSQKMEAVGQLAGGIAHDFNNILQAMIGYCEMLEECIEEESEESDFLQELRNCVVRATELTSQLLAFSRREVIEPSEIDLNRVVQGMLNLIERTIGEQIKLVSRLYEGELFIHADQGNIEQVLMNLCVNARDAMPEGGKLMVETDRIFLDSGYCQSHGLEGEGYYAVLQIKDNGCGIDEMVQSQIFEPFFTTKEVGRGTGLGLATAYGIISRHRGNIRVISEKGKGSTFLVYLPMSTGDSVVKSVPKTPEVEDSRETVLLAMNDSEVVRITKMVLENAGYRVVTAPDGDKAINLIGEWGTRLDVSVIDVFMPRRSGKEVLDSFRKANMDGRAVLVSGYSSDVMDVDSLGLERAAFISSPFSPGELLRLIGSLKDE